MATYYVRTDGSDANTGTADSAGGAFASIGKAGSVAVGGDIIYVKKGNYSVTSASTNVAGGCLSLLAGSTTTPTQVLGYNVTPGDNPTDADRPVITASGIATFKLIIIPNSGAAYIANLILDGASLTSSRGIDGSAGSSVNSIVYNCLVKNFTNSGIIGAVTLQVLGGEVTGCATVAAVQNCSAFGCSIHDNTITGYTTSVTAVVVDTISANNTGTSDGFGTTGTTTAQFIHCLAYGNGRDGFRITASAANVTMVDCYSEGNVGNQFGATAAMGNARIFNCGGKGATVVHANIAASQQVGLVTCTVTAFNNAAGNDFSLNNTAGGGAALRAIGLPLSFGGLSTASYPDIGPARHLDASKLLHPGMAGGMRG